MADIVDRAQDDIDMIAENGVRAAQIALTGTGCRDCTSCGDPIGPARRAAMPAATRCSCCQHDADHTRRVKLSGGGGFFDPTLFNRSTR